MSRRRWAAVFGALACMAAAADPGDRLTDPARESRARSLFQEIRCPVCQGASIDESEAPLAADLRKIVREHVAAGETDGQVRAFLAARYGDFVLFRPRLSPANALLWAGPILIALTGLVLLAARQRSAPAGTPPLSPEEEARLAGLDSRLETLADTLAPELSAKNATELTER